MIAHITEKNNERIDQPLKEHCENTAKYAMESIGSAKLQQTVYLAGILHDAGKGRKVFSDFIEKQYSGESVKKESVIHTFQGCIMLLDRFHTRATEPMGRLAAEIISYAVGAHHGLFDCVDMDGKNGFVHRLEKNRNEIGYVETESYFFSQILSEKDLDELFLEATKEIKYAFSVASTTYEKNFGKVFFQLGLLTRLVLSSVIYGDRRDTKEFMSQKKMPDSANIDWETCELFLEQRLNNLNATCENSDLNKIRKTISDQCREFAKRPCGIYRLNVPTGAGKTLSSLRYALAHARQHQKRRIIFIIPLLSVLDQNVKVIRDYLPESVTILEHHSNVVREMQKEETLDQFEFITDSWNAPVIVSTLVQLLNILFSKKTSDIARLQALCDSVIVIDEVQSLPKKLTVMFNMALNFLHQCCNATIVLSSATQPCFEDLKWPLRLSKNPDMVHLDESQRLAFKRTEIIDCSSSGNEVYGMDFDECAQFCDNLMSACSSLLIVCNTKKEARTLSEILMERNRADEKTEVYHLSTALCQRHRMDNLEKLSSQLMLIQNEVRNNQRNHRLICVSTQLIEAGVDLSFESAVRVLAGIDNLAQTAGRCNRSNEYGEIGKVYLIKLKNENLQRLHDIQISQNCTQRVLEDVHSSPDEINKITGEDNTRKYYRYLFEETKNEIRYKIKESSTGATFYLADLLSNQWPNAQSGKNKDYFLQQPFKTVGDYFTIFDEKSIDVLTPYAEGEQIIQELLGNEAQLKYTPWECEKILRKSKQYTVSLFQWEMEKLFEAGMLTPIFAGRLFILNKMAYDQTYGLTIIKELEVENYII